MLTLILVMVRRCNSILSMSSIMNHDTDASTRKHLNYNLSELRRVSQTPSLALIITVPNKGDPEKRDPENGSLFQVRLTGDLQVICFVGSPPSDPTSGYGDMFLLTPRSLFGPDGMLWRLEALDCRELIPAETWSGLTCTLSTGHFVLSILSLFDPNGLPRAVLWGPEALDCRPLIPPDTWSGLTRTLSSGQFANLPCFPCDLPVLVWLRCSCVFVCVSVCFVTGRLVRQTSSFGRQYFSNATTCLIRPHLSHALFIVSGITIIWKIIRQVGRTPALDKWCLQLVPPDCLCFFTGHLLRKTSSYWGLRNVQLELSEELYESLFMV